MNATNQLILMIFKTHAHESLDAQHVQAIVNAIKGKQTPMARIQKGIDHLTAKNSLAATGDAFRFNGKASWPGSFQI